MIAGGSNFPVNKKHKQNAARDRNMGEYMEIKGILDKIDGTGTGGISADDALAVPKLEAKLAGLVDSQEHMKAVNAYYRKHKTLDGCPDLSEDSINKLKVSMSRDWRKDAPPFPSYALSNNNQEIHRIRQRIDDLKNKSEYAGWTFEGGRAEANETENRLQLFFDDKPSDGQRQELKNTASNGRRVKAHGRGSLQKMPSTRRGTWILSSQQTGKRPISFNRLHGGPSRTGATANEREPQAERPSSCAGNAGGA